MPAVTSAANFRQEYPCSAERSLGPPFSYRSVMTPAGAAGGTDADEAIAAAAAAAPDAAASAAEGEAAAPVSEGAQA